MTDQEKLAEQLQLMLAKARRSLTAAELLAKETDYDFASSRTYYATFYAMQALLLTQNLSASSHGGVIKLFSQHFINTGKVDKGYGKLISRLSRKRQAGDYKFDFFFDPVELSTDIIEATEFVDIVEDYLKSEGFLTGSTP